MTKDEIIEAIASGARDLGYPGQAPYADRYADLFLEAYLGDGPTPDELSDHFEGNDLGEDANRNLERIFELWSAWKILLTSTLKRGKLLIPE